MTGFTLFHIHFDSVLVLSVLSGNQAVPSEVMPVLALGRTLLVPVGVYLKSSLDCLYNINYICIEQSNQLVVYSTAKSF